MGLRAKLATTLSAKTRMESLETTVLPIAEFKGTEGQPRALRCAFYCLLTLRPIPPPAPLWLSGLTGRRKVIQKGRLGTRVREQLHRSRPGQGCDEVQLRSKRCERAAP
eukprot:1446671-Amphidinium_carterae.1